MPDSTSFLDWNWASEHVQVELVNGEYVSAESTLILAGPPRLKWISGDAATQGKGQLYPIGLMQNIQVAQNRQVARLFEIGSKRSYFVPGRLFANFQMNRILFYGPSLLRLLYAVAPLDRGGDYGEAFNFAPEGATPAQQNVVTTNEKYASLFPQQIQLPPGRGGRTDADNRDFWTNLASEFFNIPFGMALLFKDARQRPYGAFYMEDCMIEAHSLGVDSNNIVLAEGVNGQFDMIQPMKMDTIESSTT